MQLPSLAGGLLLVVGGIAHAAEGDSLVVTGEGVNVRAQPRSGAPILLQVHRPEPALEVAREGEWVRVQLPDRDTVGWIHGSLLAAADGAPVPATEGSRAAALPAVEGAEPPASGGAAGTAPPAAVQSGAADAAPPAPVRPPEATTSAGDDDAATAPAQPGSPQVAAVGPPASDALARFRESVESLNSGALAAAGVNLFGEVRIAGEDVAQVVAAEAWDMVPEGGRQSYLNILHDRWLEIVGSPPASVQIVDQSGRVLGERAGP
jgi:hypothetical protein